MKLMSISVCACATAMAVTARFAEAFVPALGGRAGLIRVDSLRTETSPVSASRPNNAFSRTYFGTSGLSTSSRVAIGRPSSSKTTTTAMALFGLGAPEIAVCLAVAAVILGPDKLAGVAKDFGKMAGELKDVPKEFQAGIAEGEANAAKTTMIETEAVVDAQPATKKEEEQKA
ncbi:unnamed protein product [Ascophyllum nodosum]